MYRGHRKYCKPCKFETAKRFRKNPQPEEEKVFFGLYQLRDLCGLKFRNQAVIFGWIADFWCPARRLVVEIDGGYHTTPEQIRLDAIRDQVLWEKMGIVTVRIPNDYVNRHGTKAVRAAIGMLATALPKYGSSTQKPQYDGALKSAAAWPFVDLFLSPTLRQIINV